MSLGKFNVKALLIGLMSLVVIVIILAGLDRYLFRTRISAVDPKGLYWHIKSLAEQSDLRSDHTAVSRSISSAELGSFQVVSATEYIVILYTHSFTSSAYLIFSRIGSSNAWAVGWLRGTRFSQTGTFRF
jgi:hypothetical protein